MVKMGKDNYVIQENEFLFGYFWWSTGFITKTFKDLDSVQHKLVELREKQRINFESQLVLSSVLFVAILTYLILR